MRCCSLSMLGRCVALAEMVWRGQEVASIPKLNVDSVRRVFDDGSHNAFTDLCRFHGKFYLTFRSCPDGHGTSARSRIVVLVSDDASKWRQVCTFSVPKRDLRDPHFLEFNDSLFIYSGAALVPPPGVPKSLNEYLGYCVRTSNGSSWEEPVLLEGTYGHYIWRAATFGKHAYLCGRRRHLFDAGNMRKPDVKSIEAALLESEDGISWRFCGLLTEDYGDETALLFEADGSLVALARGPNDAEIQPARICRSRAPFDTWQRIDLDRYVGGPLLAKWGKHYLVGGRKAVDPTNQRTSLYWLIDDVLHEITELPSGGDNSYPGFVALSENKALLSYYSSHEGSGTELPPSAIYVAELSLQ